MGFWTLGDVVRKLREARGWRQAEFARRAGIAHTAANRLENSSELSDQRTILRAAKALDLTVADLYALAETSLTAQQREWLKLLAELNDSRRDVVMNLARMEMDHQLAEEIVQRQVASEAPSKATGTTDSKVPKG
jgi:transcriptional regulator with XRE-family HTH domain